MFAATASRSSSCRPAARWRSAAARRGISSRRTPKATFLRAQRDTLANSNADRAAELSIHAYNALLLGLDENPHAMIASLNAVADALKVASATAGHLQLRETVTHWVRLVAQTSLGSVKAPGGSMTALGPANVAPGLDKPVASRDGLIDISFVGDDYDQSAPVQLKQTRVTGITPDALRELTGTRTNSLPPRKLRDLGLAIRVSGMLSGNDSSVTVVRDEVGHIEYTDRASRSWFAPRVGVMTHATDADRRRGAKEFLEKEILDRTLDTLNPETDAKK